MRWGGIAGEAEEIAKAEAEAKAEAFVYSFSYYLPDLGFKNKTYIGFGSLT